VIYLLDTNTCIRYLNQRSTSIAQKLKTTPPRDVAVCSIVKGELFHGAMKSNNPTQTLAKQQFFLSQFQSLPFDDRAADFYGNVKAYLDRLGTPIGPNDLIIACIALANSLTLVTHNTREFNRVVGLQLEDWEII
jgi:tRNA(fMet)-specific endonuclease VapC